MSGLSGSVTLRNNAGDNLATNTNGNFTFSDGTSRRQRLCGDGVQPAGRADLHGRQWQRHHRLGNVTNVAVTCATNPVATFTVGGIVSGLNGIITLRNNAGDDLVRNANGAFTFATALASGSAYAVTVSVQPALQICTVANGSGTIASANVTNVAVTCVNNLAPLGPDLNQHGLTGSWYEPATSGQGFAVQIIPNQSPGNGLAFVSWFTFDTVIGGAERQRWYTLQGPVVTGQPNASLTIYQNTGGNFNAPPATNAQAVGTATLSFDTCSSGELSYTFTDGIRPRRHDTVDAPAAERDLLGHDPVSHQCGLRSFRELVRWCCNVGAGIHGRGRPEFQRVLLVLVYVYAERRQRRSRWTTMVYGARRLYAGFADDSGADLRDHRRDVRHSRRLLARRTVAVGTGTMTFQSCSAATFSYNFTGGKQQRLVRRHQLGPRRPGAPRVRNVTPTAEPTRCSSHRL